MSFWWEQCEVNGKPAQRLKFDWLENMKRGIKMKNQNESEFEELTQREKDVAELLCKGYRVDKIAQILCLSRTTVTTHIQHIYDKYCVSNNSTYDPRIRFAIKYDNRTKQLSKLYSIVLRENTRIIQQNRNLQKELNAIKGLKPTKKIVILGKLETKYDAPFDNPEWEIWSMNKHKDEELIPRVDKWFDIHINPAKKDADILRKDFPFEECKRLAGGNYFVTITSYLIAYAILQGATEIALYGMRFTIDHEKRQRELENVRQWIFFALGKGIKVSIPSDKAYLLPEHIIKEGEDYDQ